MRNVIWFVFTLTALAQTPKPWLLPHFAQRLELEVSNPSAEPVATLAVVPVAQAAQVALRFPGTLAIVVAPGAGSAFVASQADDLDGDGTPDEFVFPVELGPHAAKRFDIYYSTTLREEIPWPKRVHACHVFGYNHATVALESEQIGYRTYGGFFLDIQGRMAGKPGLYNTLVGYFGSGRPSEAGWDVIHLGDTLGLGGLFLRGAGRLFRPPLNMPDYAHKPSSPEVPRYRVISSGPVRAVVEAKLDRWRIGADEVSIEALYSMAAGESYVECRFRILPLRLSAPYETGAGIRHLPDMKLDRAAGRIALSGTQSRQIGPLGLALYYEPAEAEQIAPVVTPEDANEAVVFRGKLEPGRAVAGRYWMAGAWSGSGIPDLLLHLANVGQRARAAVRVGNFRFAATPDPKRLEME